ncbi:CLAVATA3/ESR (CLE)-related protein 46 [Ziziphus jujuba]|uniref:CLAVATA3/ESR (CLE)-related protein 46 n=1 Tax=Ziziphus jujuba TaxID=326968 RepID=A0A6P3ZH67_ZIZJJ|nr:CLAVATA3/ESR (CLE)-related protein 46 [Ziziphus jujuba]
MLVRSVCQNTTSSMHKLMLNMGRQTLIYLLLAWLLLAAYPRHYSTVSVQAIESAHFKLKPAQPNSRSGRFVFPAWVDGKKIHKAPSGPNPVGNHRPPSKH